MSGVALSDGSVTKFCYDFVIPTALSAVCHPFVCARTLMMLGHEFEPPTLGRNLIGLQRYMYPNVFNYIGHLRGDVGLFPIFTVGLPASIIGSAIKSSVCECYLREHVTGYMYKKSVIETEQGWDVFVQETCKLTAGRCLGLLVSYPFQVIMIRQIAQLVGKETMYSNILKAFVEINVNEGLPGLFGGLIPRLLGEVIAVWLTASMAYVVNKYLLPEDTDQVVKEHTPYIAGLLLSSCTHLVPAYRLTCRSRTVWTATTTFQQGIPLCVEPHSSSVMHRVLCEIGVFSRLIKVFITPVYSRLTLLDFFVIMRQIFWSLSHLVNCLNKDTLFTKKVLGRVRGVESFVNPLSGMETVEGEGRIN
ncbi:mitochondrial carrier 2 [Echinococcus multilocularis]|uniref:Mitochondrial carrier 2 n=1 Tax=Echinococcus multilocularis TaxID=6211 RepID=A0A068Y6G6_ECHMU|nr:mitochondrial carrier 2 [Echinococcus multilocularis]